MKILIYAESYYPNLGGLERNTDVLARVLSENHQVIILTPVTSDYEADENKPFKVIRSSQTLSYKKLIKNTDLLIINGGIALKVVVWALLFKKQFWAIYQMASLFYQADNKRTIGKLSNKMRKLIASQAQLNIAVSEYSAKVLEKHFNQTKVSYLINPLDRELERIIFDHGPKKNLPYKFLFVGRLIEGKGIYLLIEAFKELQKKHQAPLELHIAGSGPEDNIIKDLAIPSSCIIFHGRVEGSKLLDLYRMAHLCIIPSDSHIEGSPLVIAESLYSDTPLLVSNQPAMVDSVGKAGFSFISGDIKSLFIALQKFITDKKFRDELNANCAIESEKFSFDNYQKKVNQLVNKLYTKINH